MIFYIFFNFYIEKIENFNKDFLKMNINHIEIVLKQSGKDSSCFNKEIFNMSLFTLECYGWSESSYYWEGKESKTIFHLPCKWKIEKNILLYNLK